MHEILDGAARCGDCGNSVRNLRYRQSERIPSDDSDFTRQGQGGTARCDCAADPDAIHAQRNRFRARFLPCAWRYDRYFSGRACGIGGAHRDVRRRDRESAIIRSVDWARAAEDSPLHRLSRLALCDATCDGVARDRYHQGGIA